MLLDEHLPNQFYVSIADRLETRLVACMESIKYFSAQLKKRLAAIEQSKQDGANTASRVGPKQVLELIRYQNEAFMQIAASIAGVHREVDEVKEVFLKVITKMDSNRVNPFEAADRKEQAGKRLVEQKMQKETMKHVQRSVFGNVTSGMPVGFAAPSSTSGGTTPAATGGFGFGSPAPTATSSFGAPASNGFGFGGASSTPGPTVGFSLGGSTTPAASTGFGFGTPAAATGTAGTGTGNLFGIPPISTGATPSAGGFGTPSTPHPNAFGSLGGGAKSSLGALDLATRSPGGGKSLFGGLGAAPLAAPDAFKQPMAPFVNPFENPDTKPKTTRRKK